MVKTRTGGKLRWFHRKRTTLWWFSMQFTTSNQNLMAPSWQWRENPFHFATTPHLCDVNKYINRAEPNDKWHLNVMRKWTHTLPHRKKTWSMARRLHILCYIHCVCVPTFFILQSCVCLWSGQGEHYLAIYLFASLENQLFRLAFWLQFKIVIRVGDCGIVRNHQGLRWPLNLFVI